MPAPQITTEDWNTAWSLIDRSRGKEIHDNIFNKPSLLNYFVGDASEKDTGGKELMETLEYADTDGAWFSGHDSLPTTEPETATVATTTWAYFATPVIIAFDKEMESRNATLATDLIKHKYSNARKSIKNDMDIALASAQSGKSCLGIQDWVSATPTTGTIAGLNRATATWYRNQVNTTSTDFDAKAVTDFYDGMTVLNTLYNSCSDAETTPDLHCTTQTFYGQFENLFAGTGYARLQMDSKNRMSIYNGAPMFHQSPVIFSRNIASGYWYMLNKDALKVRIQSGVNFMSTPFRSPHNQLTQIKYVVHSMQLIGVNPRRTGVKTTFT